MTDELPTRARFQDAYESRKPPWDIGRPQRAIIEAIEQVEGPILDAGCGTGEHALYFAQRAHEVTGIDFLDDMQQRDRCLVVNREIKCDIDCRLVLRRQTEWHENVMKPRQHGRLTSQEFCIAVFCRLRVGSLFSAELSPQRNCTLHQSKFQAHGNTRFMAQHSASLSGTLGSTMAQES